MPNLIAPPTKPIADWEAILHDWLNNVTHIADDVERWANSREWATRRDQKTITEAALGTYSVPVVLIHLPQGRLLLDPIARNIYQADGRIDLCVMPSYDSYMIVNDGGQWHLYTKERNDSGREWNESTFVAAVHELLQRS